METALMVLEEAVREIADAPGKYLIELVQFGILAAIIKVFAFGTKKKTGMITRMLADRQQRVAAQLQDADAGRLALADAQREVALIHARAAEEVRVIERDARKRAREEKAAVFSEAEVQAAAIMEGARSALDRERTEMLQGIREQLVEVVTQSTQQVLEQGFSQADQRAIVQKAIVSGIEDLERVALTS